MQSLNDSDIIELSDIPPEILVMMIENLDPIQQVGIVRVCRITAYLVNSFDYDMTILGDIARGKLTYQKALWRIAETGNVRLAKWCITFPDVNVHADKDRALKIACRNQKFEMTNWLAQFFPDTDSKYPRQGMLRAVCYTNNDEAFIWFLSNSPEIDVIEHQLDIMRDIFHARAWKIAAKIKNEYPDFDINVITDIAMWIWWVEYSKQ